MLENRTVLSVCAFVLICQIVIWRAYTADNSSEIYKLDGIISDPIDGIRAPRCWAHVAGTYDNTEHNDKQQYGKFHQANRCKSLRRYLTCLLII